MNKTFSNIPKVMIVLTVIFFLSNGFAMDIPRQINYQGKLMENGIPVNGIKTITFSIMDMDMNPLWTETHENVLIKNGLYSVQLGSISPIPLSTFEQISVKLRITVDNTHLEPEIGVLSVAYAFVAKKADHANRASVADRLAGDSIYVNQSMNVGIGTLQPKEKLDVNGAIRIGSTEASNPGTIRYTNNDFQGYDGSEWVSFSKKNGSVIHGIAGENIQGASCPMPVYMSKDGLIKVQNQMDQSIKIYGVNKYAQSFKTDMGTTEIRTVAINLTKKGNLSGNVHMSIVELDDKNLPNTIAEKSMNINASTIVNGWNEFMFEPYLTVSPQTVYAIVVSLPNGDSQNYMEWLYSSANTYGEGVYLSSNDYGSSWNRQAGYDFTFKLFGNPRLFKCMASDIEKLDCIGFAITEANIGEQIWVQTNGIVSGFNGLNSGKKYYIQNNGGIGLEPGIFKKVVAIAVNTNEISQFWTDTLEIATKDEAINGRNDEKVMTPETTRLAIEKSINFATQQEAVAGLSNMKIMTPQTTAFSIDSHVSNQWMSKAQAKNLVDGSNADHLHTHNYSVGGEIVGDLYTAYQKDATQEEVGSHSVETSIKNPRLVEFMVTLGVKSRCSSLGNSTAYTTYRILYSFMNKVYIIKEKMNGCAKTHSIDIFSDSSFSDIGMRKRCSDFKEINFYPYYSVDERAPGCNLLTLSLNNQTIKIEYTFHKTGFTETEYIDFYKGRIAISPLIVY